MNPARSLGPAVALGFWTNHWVILRIIDIIKKHSVILITYLINFIFQIYWAGPIVGGIFGGIIHSFVLKRHTEEASSYDL